VLGPLLTTTGTIEFLVDECPGPFLTTFGTKVNGPFLTFRVASKSTSPQASSCMRTWQYPYEIIGDGSDEGGHRYQTLKVYSARKTPSWDWLEIHEKKAHLQVGALF